MAELSLPLLLPRIVEVAGQVVGADYAALGVISIDAEARTADVQGAVLGKKVAHWLGKHYFQPVG